jgi:hypothetical protein
MLLYKYCGPSGVAILQNDSIWLTVPRAFNDPFDVNPHVEAIVGTTIPSDRRPG